MDSNMNREIISGEDFLYQRGTVSTVYPWYRPSYDYVRDYLQYLKDETTVFDEFEIYLTGGILYDFDTTWDVDIFLVGGSESDAKIEEQLNNMTDIALNKFFMLVDIAWMERRPSNLTYSQMEENNFFSEDITYKKIGHFKKKLGNETVECDMRILPNLETIGDYLIKGSFGGFKHADKMIDKVKNHPKQSVIMTFSAEEFLLSDRDHFLSNTNR
jgi:hypothetical protein